MPLDEDEDDDDDEGTEVTLEAASAARSANMSTPDISDEDIISHLCSAMPVMSTGSIASALLRDPRFVPEGHQPIKQKKQSRTDVFNNYLKYRIMCMPVLYF